MWRFEGVLLLSLALSACSVSQSTPGPIEPERMTLSPLSDIAVGGDDRARQVDATVIRLGPDDGLTMLLAMKRPYLDVGCLQRARVSLYVNDPRAVGAVEIFPSHVRDIPRLTEGDVVQAVGLLLDNQPKGEAEVLPDPGWLTFDVTEIVRLWISRAPFPSQGIRAPRGLLALAVRGDFEAVGHLDIATLESTTHRPRMLVDRVCPRD